MLYRILQFVGQMGILGCLLGCFAALCMWCDHNLTTLSFLGSIAILGGGVYFLFWLCFPEERSSFFPAAHDASSPYHTDHKNSAA